MTDRRGEININELAAKMVVRAASENVTAWAELLQELSPKENVLHWQKWLYENLEVNARDKAAMAEAFSKGLDPLNKPEDAKAIAALDKMVEEFEAKEDHTHEDHHR
jgi:hypothetical protein